MTHSDQEQAAEAIEGALDTVKEHTGALSGLSVAGIAGGMVRGRMRRGLRGRRRRGRLFRRFALGLLIVVGSVATCSFGVEPSQLTASYGDPVPATTEDARRVLTRGVETLQRAPQSGRVRLTLTEAEATSALGLGMMLPEMMQAAGRIPEEEIREIQDLDVLRARVREEAERQREEMAERLGFFERILLAVDPKIRTGDVQVRFEEGGEVVVAGYVQAWRFRQPGIFVVAPRAAAGELDFDFVSGRVGRLPLPELVFDWVGKALATVILLGDGYAEVSEITVEDGTLTFEGRLTGGG